MCATEKITISSLACTNFNPGRIVSITPSDSNLSSYELCIQVFLIGGAKSDFAFKVFGNIIDPKNISSHLATIITTRNGNIYLEFIL